MLVIRIITFQNHRIPTSVSVELVNCNLDFEDNVFNVRRVVNVAAVLGSRHRQ